MARRQKRALKAPKKDAAVGINPRRSARLAAKPKLASATTATKERQAPRPTAKNILLLSPVLNPGSKHGRKEDSEEEDEDDYEKEGYESGRKKKAVRRRLCLRQRLKGSVRREVTRRSAVVMGLTGGLHWNVMASRLYVYVGRIVVQVCECRSKTLYSRRLRWLEAQRAFVVHQHHNST